MSIVTEYEVWQGRDLEYTSDGPGTKHRVFLVLTDNPLDTAEYIVQVSRLCPALWSGYPGVPTHTANKINAKQNEQYPALWNITVEYSNRTAEKKDNKSDGKDGSGGTDKGQKPDDDIPQYEYDKGTYLEPAAQDSNGLKVANSAGDPFLPAIMVQKYEKIIRIKKNISADRWQPLQAQLDKAQGAVNQGPFKIDGKQFDTQTAKITSMHSRKFSKNNQLYYEVNTEVRVRNNWFTKILDCGANEIVGGQKRPIIKNGVRVRVWALQGGVAADTPDVLTFDFNDKIDFGGLPIF